MNAQLQAVISTPPQLTLTAQQSAALTAMLAFARGEHGARMMTLEGYAGTGKTTLVGELLRTLGRQLNIAVAAPTNKAVNVLREKIGADVPVEYSSPMFPASPPLTVSLSQSAALSAPRTPATRRHWIS